MNFIKQVFGQFDLSKVMFIFYNSWFLIDFARIFRVFNFVIGLLNDAWNFFELIVSLFLMVQHDSVENFRQVGVQVGLDWSSEVFHLLKLGLQFLQGIQFNAHI